MQSTGAQARLENGKIQSRLIQDARLSCPRFCRSKAAPVLLLLIVVGLNLLQLAEPPLRNTTSRGGGETFEAPGHLPP
ncbi:hypothetical protein OG215_35875 [Streptomyces globisporus]|uniref:hypothetical protein n=1 Tax=Streptomyces globisporus TaxID=1908 RepID=UPI00386DCB11|nr:hypothetical protein OG215_35875 [Streptomyces globisporus]